MRAQISPEFLSLQTALAGRYSLERELGRGGMGIVFLAHEVALDRPVALKLLPPDLAERPDVRERFLQEARTAAKLSHPNIVPIFAVDEVDGFVFFAMAYIEGQTLGERVRSRGPLPEKEATRLIREVAWALSYAHVQGVVHRDVKPDNILLEEGTGRALVTDFGIALVGVDLETERQEQVVGTAEFMSPEQATGAAVDARSDLYALGAVAHYAVCGHAPFEAPSAAAVLGMHVGQPAPRIATRVPGLSSTLAAVIDRCLRKEPARRFADGAEVADAVAQESATDRELPVPLRVFIKRLRETSRSSGGALALIVLFGVGPLIGLLASGSVIGMLVMALIVGVIGVVWGGQLAYQARKVLKAGHTIEDARLALQRDVMRRNEEFRFEVGDRVTPVDRAATQVTLGSFGVTGLSAALLWVFPGASVLWSTFWLSLVAGLGGVAYKSHRAQTRGDLVGERWLKIWGGRVGDVLFRVAGLGLDAPTALPSAAHRPTEMALGLAAVRLYEELPEEHRQALTGLPRTIRELEEDARTLRGQVQELNAVLAELDDDPGAAGADARETVRAEVAATRDEAEDRLRRAVTALETIRVGLLRLHAGEPVVHSVTMQLDAARDLSGDMANLLEGHREVERLLAQRRATGTFTIVGG